MEVYGYDPYLSVDSAWNLSSKVHHITDLDELYRLSDRLVTIYEGRITGEFKPDEIGKQEISHYMTGGGREERT